MDTTPYIEAQLRARMAERALSERSLREIGTAIKRYAAQLAAELRQLPDTAAMAARREAIKRSIAVITREAELLNVRLSDVVRTGRDASFSDILDIHNEATRMVADSVGVPNHLLGAVEAPGLTMAGVWESLGTGARTWKTLLTGYVADAAADATRIVTTALIEGMGPDELARRLRPYVEGSETFQRAFRDAGEIGDKLLNDPLRTGEARKLLYNADRIAFSEIHNARAEAELQAFAADPFVKAVRWELSPNRGTQVTPDACDVLANTDFYGMGKGIYPVSAVPVSPHPFDRCERMPVSRGLEDYKKPKPNPPRLRKPKYSVGPAGKEMTRAALENAARVAENAMAAMASSGARAALQTIGARSVQAPPSTLGSIVAASAEAPLVGTVPIAQIPAPPPGITKKHDVIAWYRVQGASGDEIIAKMNTELGFKIKGGDISGNAQWYGVFDPKLGKERIKAHPIIQALTQKAPAAPSPAVVAPKVTGPVPTVEEVSARLEVTAKSNLSQMQKAETELEDWRLKNLKPVVDEYSAMSEELENYRTYLSEQHPITDRWILLEQRPLTSIETRRLNELSSKVEAARHRLTALHAEYESRSEAFNSLRKAYRAELHAAIATPGAPSIAIDTAKLRKADTVRSTVVTEAQAFLNDVLPANVKASVRYRSIHGRASYNDSTRSISIAMSDDAGTVIHEIGHALEYQMPEWQRRAVAFLKERTKGETPQPLNKLKRGFGYRRNEYARPDKFKNPYTGKTYPDGATEIISMGLEQMWRDPHKFWVDDPDYFRFIWDLIRYP